MNVTCSGCHTQYKIDETKVPATGGFIRCKACGERVRIPPPGEAIPLPETTSPKPDPNATTQVSATPSLPSRGSASLPLPTPLSKPDPMAETLVVSTPSIPARGSAIPLPETPVARVDPAAETRVVSTPSLPPRESGASPLAGSTAGPAPRPVPAAPTVLPAPTPPSVAAADGAALLTQTPHFLDNLPAAPLQPPVVAATRQSVPAPDLAGVTEPDIIESADEITDLPTPATDASMSHEADVTVTKSVVYDDLPTEARPEPSDLPRVDEAPRLMDDGLAITDTTPQLGSAPTVGGTTAAVAEIMRVEDKPAKAEPAKAEPAKAEPAKSEASLGPNDETLPAAKGLKRRRNGLVLGVGAGVGALLVATTLVALVTPWLGLQQLDPLGLSTKKSVAQPPDANNTPTNKTPAKTPTPAPVPTPTPTPAPSPAPAVVVLTAENVDKLGWRELSAATAARAKSAADDDVATQGLLKWARFRLAKVFGDEGARELLVEASADKPIIPKLDALSAAGTVGSLILAGKIPLARKLGESLQKTRFKAVPQLAYALATTYDHRPEILKGIKQTERALKAAPGMTDARLLHASLELWTRDKESGARELVEVVAKANDPDLAVRAAEALLAAAEVAQMDDVVAGIQDPTQTESLPPIRRGTFLKVLVRKRLRAGDVEGALAAATARVKVEPTNDAAIVELGRLTAATGGDPTPVLKSQSAEATDVDRAHLLAERVRLALHHKDVESAKKALEAGASLDAKQASGWLKLAEGWIAERNGQLPVARAAYAAAAKGRPKFAPARLALALMTVDKPGVLLKKLSDMDKANELPEATLELARLMKARGNPGGSSQLLDRVLWTDPTLSEPIELVLQWADTLDQAGQQNRAEAVVKSLHDARPDDVRAVHQLIAMARRSKRYDAAVDWYRLLVTADPKNAQLQVGLAEVLNDAGKLAEAQAQLDELFKQAPAARDADALAQLARAFAGRDDFKAKELFDDSLRMKPQAKTYMLKGAAEEKRGKTEEAEVAYKKALELEPELTAASLSLAHIAIERRSFPQAVAALEQVLAKNPQHAKAAELLGDALVELNKPREAVARYVVALAAGGENPGILLKVAKLQIDSLGQTEESVKNLRRAVKADPKLADAHYYLGLALKDNSQLGEAKNELQAYLRLSPEGEYAADVKQAIADLEKP